MSNTPNLNLPLIQERQAHKHITMNEALSLLDILTQLAVESMAQVAPPPTPTEGVVYIVPAANATGVWAGKANQLAAYQNGAWVYFAPKEGFSAWNRADNQRWTFYNNSWRSN